MPGDDYSAVVSGGLKIKGVNSSSKVSKHKKKKLKPAQPMESEKNPDKSEDTTDGALTEELRPKGEEAGDITKKDHGGEGSREREREEEATPPPQRAGKTEAELRHEERRRKRLDERLKREGTKTHKERVEELNRYLSNLSEHHDMPRIGPG
ncbi:hypothetical protein ABVK25_005876 [Lepraria finkii]|uniref:Protein FAM32A n=1 Tax=Lepraria finkii TaxID=1340010 RepID=A0ABR4B7V8_9LECA